VLFTYYDNVLKNPDLKCGFPGLETFYISFLVIKIEIAEQSLRTPNLNLPFLSTQAQPQE